MEQGGSGRVRHMCCCIWVFSMVVYIKDGKEKNNSLCSFVPGDATAFF